MTFSLLLLILSQGLGDQATKTMRKAGATGSTRLLGRGTAPSTILELLGLGESGKEIILSITPSIINSRVKTAIHNEFSTHNNPGILIEIPVNTFCRTQITHQESTPNMQNQMICTIVNKGYALDAMATARKAGATGGTIIQGRGTANEAEQTFFGVTITPEKELLLILAPNSTSSAIEEAIRSLPCLQEGTGIEFSIPVQNINLLGKNKA